MKKVFVVVLGAAVGLVSGCEYYKALPSEIVSRETESSTRDSDSSIVPSGEGTRASDGTVSGTGDEEVLPSEAPAPGPRPARRFEEGDGVVEDIPEIGHPPVEPAPLPAPVSCDEKSFAFVSKRGGRSDVYVQEAAGIRKLTANGHNYRTYQNLSFKPGTKTFAVDDFFIIHPLVPFPVLSVLTGDLAAETLALEVFASDAYTSGLVWNARGTKTAYIAIRTERGGRVIQEIRVQEDRETARVVTSNESDPSLKFEQVAWAGDQLIYSASASGVTTLYYVRWTTRGEPRTGILEYDAERTPILDTDGQAILGEDGLPLTQAVWETVHASEPAVSRDGRTIAFVVKTGSVSNITTCRFGKGEFDFHDYRSKCRNTVMIPGHGNNTSPSWSPDGRWIYFVSDRDGNREIYRVRPDGTGEERLTNDPADDASPAPFAPYASCE